MKRIFSSLMASCLVLSLTACAASTPAPAPAAPAASAAPAAPAVPAASAPAAGGKVVIGGIGPLTGEVSVYGIATINGAKLAMEEVKTVLGKEIDFAVRDDKGDATEAVNAYNQLINNEKAVAIIGAVTSGPSAAIGSTSQSFGTPIITPTGTALDVTTYGENIFRACFIDPYQGEVMANFSFDKLNAKTAAVIYNTGSDYSVGLAESFKATFESKGGKIVNYEAYNDTDKDFKAQLTKIAPNKPDVLFMPDYYTKVNLIGKQARDAGIESTFLGADGWDGVLAVAEDKNLLNDSYFCNHYSNDDPDPLVQGFIQKYKAAYNEEPNAFAALGYDAVKIMVNAIEKAGEFDNAKIVEQLKNTDITSLTGRITFDAQRNPVKGVAILTIKDGEYKMHEKLNP